MQDINLIKEQICDVCHKTWQLGWVAANDGNVSVKLEDGRIIATPTGMSKSFITPDKLIIIDEKGNVLEDLKGSDPQAKSRCIFAVMKSAPMFFRLSTLILPEQRALRLLIRQWICII